jgi:hypothetical protein
MIMTRPTIALAAVSLLCGCATSGGPGGTSRQFDVSLTKANAAVQSLYPSQLEWAPLADGEGRAVRIRRDELSRDGEVIVLAEENGASNLRTRIVLTSIAPQRTKVSVQASRSKKSVLLPDRDQALETAKLDAIAEQIQAPASRNTP